MSIDDIMLSMVADANALANLIRNGPVEETRMLRESLRHLQAALYTIERGLAESREALRLARRTQVG